MNVMVEAACPRVWVEGREGGRGRGKRRLGNRGEVQYWIGEMMVVGMNEYWGEREGGGGMVGVGLSFGGFFGFRKIGIFFGLASRTDQAAELPYGIYYVRRRSR